MSEKWKTGIGNPSKTRWGCFLPDLTRLARCSSTTDLPREHIGFRGEKSKELIQLPGKILSADRRLNMAQNSH